jgi:hypothetical protein
LRQAESAQHTSQRHPVSHHEEIVIMNASRLVDPSAPKPAAHADLQEAIRRRAEEIYIRNGRIPGRDAENWAQAEKEILTEAVSSDRRAVVVRVKGVQYLGEYDAASADGYTPGEFAKGEPVPVRFDGDKMFVKRPNGKELETTIVKALG